MEWLTPGLITVVALAVALGALWLAYRNKGQMDKIGQVPAPPPTDVKGAAELNAQAADKQHEAAVLQESAAVKQESAAEANKKAAEAVAVTAKEQAKE